MNTTLRSLAPVLVALALAPVPGSAAPWPQRLPPGSHVPGELLVKFKAAASARGGGSVAAKGHSVVRSLRAPGLKQVKAAPGQSVSEAIAAYRADPDVEYAQPNYVYRAAAEPNDPEFRQLWGFRNTRQTIEEASYPTNNPGTFGADARVERAWEVSTDCSAVTVAVIDTGVNYSHEDLAANMWSGGATHPNHGYDFVDDDDDPMDLNGHGTHVAGTIGAVGNNARGVAGVCWTANVMAVRVLDVSGMGTSVSILDGISFAVERGAKVINMSLGGGGGFDQAYSDAITEAAQADVAVIVAAGNELTNVDGGTPTYPCAFTHPNLVCVAALDQAYQLASFSNYGATSVDVGAPGTNIRSAWNAFHVTVTDPLNSGWHPTTTTAGGWSYAVLSTTIGPLNVLANPASFPYGTYRHDTDDRVYKTFDLTGASVASLDVAVLGRTAIGDRVSARCSNAVTDPFSGAGVALFEGEGAADGTVFSSDLTGCAGAPASIGFRLTSDASVTDQGVVLGLLSITTQHPSTTTYNTIDGTSMATPLVAGIATLLRAHNPLYTATDAVSALEAAGPPVAALAGKTTTGRAVDAMATLAHIRAPTGLGATLE
jgi:subtilisin family serine protease